MLCLRNWLVKLQQIEFNNCTTIQGVGSTIGVRVCVFVCVYSVFLITIYIVVGTIAREHFK